MEYQPYVPKSYDERGHPIADFMTHVFFFVVVQVAFFFLGFIEDDMLGGTAFDGFGLALIYVPTVMHWQIKRHGQE